MKATKFDRFPFQPFIHKAIIQLGFYEPTEIQERLIPSILNGESVIGQSQTGTGKTHAFLFPVLHAIDPEKQEAQAIITAPTRELAQQIYDEVLKIIACNDEYELTAKLLVGGTDRARTMEKLKNQPQIVVGTPGRILDMVKEQVLQVYSASVLVIDEADLMLDMGFIHEIDQIASRMNPDLQMLVFSATIPEKLKPFLKKYMENPKFTHVAPKQAAAKNLEHVLVPLRNRDKLPFLADILRNLSPFLALIFTNTKKMTDEVADYLIQQGLTVGRIHGDLSPRERKKMMKDIRDLKYQYVVATDLAARGIDIEGVSHVINYEIPRHDLEFYIHRSGRTARADYSGTAITLYEQSDEDSIAKLEKMGVTFVHKDFKQNEWLDLGPRNKRKARKKTVDEIAIEVHQMVKKPKKVKPGYKKKRNEQINKLIRKKKRNR